MTLISTGARATALEACYPFEMSATKFREKLALTHHVLRLEELGWEGEEDLLPH